MTDRAIFRALSQAIGRLGTHWNGLRCSFVWAIMLAVVAFAASPTALAWDSLQAQLKQSGVRPATALAQLIAANQDFSLLRPEEATDRLPYPPWLRVYWRKAHPEGPYDGSDPTGGYPRALRDMHQWMLSHQDLVAGPRDAASRLTPSTAPTTAVGGNLRISGAQSEPRSESDIRVNFWDRTKIIAASNSINSKSSAGTGAQSQYYSTNGGISWGRTELPLQSDLGDNAHVDPTVDWTSDGTAWATTVAMNVDGPNLGGRAYKSTDNGATWLFDDNFAKGQTRVDKQMMWVDHSAASPYANNIYVIWHAGPVGWVNRRTAAGWQTPIRITGAETNGTPVGGDIQTNATGDVFAFWPSTSDHKIFVSKSIDGGASYAPPVPVATTVARFAITTPSFALRRALIYVSASAHRSATRNEVYASWVDLTGAAGCASEADEPGTDVTSTCKSRVWFARSTDGAATWSAPVMLNNQSGLNDQYNQRLTVDETNGMLGIVYYDTVGDPARLKTDVWYQSSFDGGLNWSAPTKITTAQTDETGNGADLTSQYGDYNGLSASGGVVFPSWTDRRSGAQEEIWTASIDERVTVSVAATGTGVGDMTATGIACRWDGATVSGTCANKVPRLAGYAIVAVPRAGSLFDGWSGCTSTSTTAIAGDTCTIQPNADVTVTANWGSASGVSPAIAVPTLGSTALVLLAFLLGAVAHSTRNAARSVASRARRASVAAPLPPHERR